MSTPYILSDLGDIQFEVDGMYLIMKLKPGVISGLGGGTVIDIIKSIDLKEATDLNVFSAVRITQTKKIFRGTRTKVQQS